LHDLETSVRRLITTPQALYEPMKRLTLHLAEQLVLAELTLSPQAIERLVRRGVDELAPQRLAPIMVELNPADLALLQSHGTDWPWHLQANDELMPGSVRASASDAVVSDLIEHRLEALACSLLLDTSRSTAQSAFQPNRLAARMASEQVVDAQPRMPPAAAPAPAAAAAPIPAFDVPFDLPDLNLSDGDISEPRDA
jgi:hypothetical protein